MKQQFATQSKQTQTDRDPCWSRTASPLNRNDGYKLVMLRHSTCSAAVKLVSAWRKPSLPATTQHLTTPENCLFHPLTALLFRFDMGRKSVIFNNYSFLNVYFNVLSIVLPLFHKTTFFFFNLLSSVVLAASPTSLCCLIHTQHTGWCHNSSSWWVKWGDGGQRWWTSLQTNVASITEHL